MSGPQFVLSAFVVTWLTASLRLAGPVLLAALGETFAEQSGVLNIGIEGTILLGALTSFLVTYYTGMIWISVLVAESTAMSWTSTPLGNPSSNVVHDMVVPESVPLKTPTWCAT